MNRLITASAGLALIAAPLALTTATTANASDAAARQAPAYSVSAKVNKSVVTVGEDVVKVRGKVSPRAAGDKVVLQQRMEGKKAWKKSGTTAIKKNGRYVLKDKPSAFGAREYRVLKPGSDGVRKGVSKTLAVEVYEWKSLTERAHGALSNMWGPWGSASVNIGSVSYSDSLLPAQAGTPAYIEYTLGRLCTDLRTTYALDDVSASGSTGAVKLIVDGETVVDQGLVVGQVVESTTDLTDVFRLRYELTSTATPASKPTVASPEVLCTQ